MSADTSPESRYPSCVTGDAKFQALLEAAVDAIIMIDHEGRVMHFNPAAERIFGYSHAEVTGRNVTMLMPELHAADDPRHLIPYLASDADGGVGVRRQAEGRRRNGEVFPLEVSMSRVSGAEAPQFVAFLRDASVGRRVQQETRDLERRLKRVARFSTMGEMAAGLAHELNQPLAAITTYAQTASRMLADSKKYEEDLRHICGEVSAQAQRAGAIIKRMRGFLRLQQADRERLDVNALITEILKIAELDARDRGVPLWLKLADGLPPVHGNAVELQQVLLNLIRNAVDSMSPQQDRSRGVIIATASSTDGNGLQISITDHGGGVSPAIADQIFHPFVTSKHNGLGLGLSISRTIVQAHGGRLAFSPNPAGGTIFSLSLPASLED